MAFALSAVMGIATYELVRWYLIDKREALALQESTFNAQTVKGQLGAGDVDPEEVVAALQSNNAPAVLRIDDTWYAAVVQLDEAAVPESLRDTVQRDGAASQRTSVDGTPYLVYGFSLPGLSAQYFEFVSASEYERTLSVLATMLLVAASVTTVGGAAAGWFISRRVLRPLTSVASSARSIAEGNLAHRLEVGEDPDLLAVAVAFNEMADAVEARVEREHRFTADVSHELRTPLTALGAAVSLAKRDELPERSRYAMTILDEQVQHFTRLTVELLEISRIDSGVATLHREDVDVGSLIGSVLDQAGVDRSVLRLTPDTEIRWSLDGTRLERIVANLVENAAKYAGGVTALGVTVVDDELCITVDDAGPGVPDDDRLAIFGRFNRGSMPQPEEQPKGTGLGLALVDEHVRMHGGHVAVTSNAAGGARFVVTFPGQGT